jgi:hypothetical protein
MLIKLWGYVEKDISVFSLKIDPEETIGDLKDEIKKKMELKGPASNLEIYKLGGEQGIPRGQLKVRRCLPSVHTLVR